jgi:hypothetical protein
VAEEVRFFLRTAIYTLTITVIYWFVSYEIAGSTLLLTLGLAAIFFVVVGIVMIRQAGKHALPEDTRPAKGLRHLVGFDEKAGEASSPLALEEDLIPSSSIWPLVTAVAAFLLGLGLIYGGWMWGPATVLAIVALWGWVTQLYG